MLRLSNFLNILETSNMFRQGVNLLLQFCDLGVTHFVKSYASGVVFGFWMMRNREVRVKVELPLFMIRLLRKRGRQFFAVARCGGTMVPRANETME